MNYDLSAVFLMGPEMGGILSIPWYLSCLGLSWINKYLLPVGGRKSLF